MAIGTSILLLAVGAILRFAVSYTMSGFSIHTIGVILMIVGALGLVLGLTLWGPWSYRSRTSRRVVSQTAGLPPTVQQETVEHEQPPRAVGY
jgi:hypothetical protein